MANSITIRLIRHEKTQANVERKYIGSTDEPIIKVNPRMMTHEPEKIIGSALQRCHQTAQLYFPNIPYEAYAALNEIHFGDFEMKTYADLQHDPVYRAWIDDPLAITPPNGESFVAFKDRVLQAFYEIVQSAGNYTFIVHGGVIRILLQMFVYPEKSFQQIIAEHHTQYELTWSSLKELKEGIGCTFYSADYLTEKPTIV